MAALPVIRGASAALYPFQATYSFLTGTGPWENGAQQRWIKRPGALVKFALPYAQLTQTQKNTVKTAISAAKGRFDNTLTLTLGAITYTNHGIDLDEWAATEAKTTQYAAPLKLTQAITQNLSPGTAGGAFPVLASGSIGVLPYTQKKRFQTIGQRVEAGPNYTLAEFGGGWTGYPTDGLMAWEFAESGLSDADTATRVAHFLANFGKAMNFQFTDEDGAAYSKTHYASDDLVINYRGVNDSSIRIALEATF
jgi:hypothetical protein